MNHSLCFHQDGTFKIVQFTDLHIGKDVNHEPDQKTFQRMDEVVKIEEPDLIAITGDLIWSDDGKNPEKTYRRVLDHIEQWNIPYAIVYGNHDSEAHITREELFSLQESYKNSLAKAGPQDIHGVGNYVLPISSYDKDVKSAILYFLDSGAYAPNEIGGYEWIHHDQVQWFIDQTKNFKGLPSLAFFHIPLPEFNEVWENGQVMGTRREEICSPKINTGLFSAMLEAEGVLGAFVGHDHDNDFCGKLHGLSLCYGRSVGYNVYGNLERGARVIQLTENKKTFTSWIQTGSGEKQFIYQHDEEE